MAARRESRQVSTLFALSMLTVLVLPNAYAHVHSHKDTLNKERVKDGGAPVQDSEHYVDGEHRSEFDHEAVLGSKDAAEEFDQLSPEEAKQKLEVIAKKMDKDKDGFVNRKELVGWVMKSFRLLTEEEALERLEDVDSNHDGKVTWDEHLAETFNYDRQKDAYQEDEEDDTRLIQEDEELFKEADLNKDGFLDKKEYPLFSHPEEFSQMQDVLLRQALKKRDLDGDGLLSLKEFTLDSEGRPLTGEQLLVEKDRFHSEFDKNKDGKLDKNEALEWLVPNNEETAQQEVDHLIEESDSDKDGKLSIKEIVDHHDVFVGSEATDYGEHLDKAHRFDDEL